MPETNSRHSLSLSSYLKKIPGSATPRPTWQDIFRVLANHPACAGPLQARLLPTLLSILSSADASGGGQPAGLKGHSHDMSTYSFSD